MLETLMALSTLAVSSSVHAGLPAEGVHLAETDPNRAIQLVTFRTHSRLVLRVDQGVDPQWKTDARGFELTLKGLSLADFGAPVGLEESWAKEIQGELTDPRIERLELLERAGSLVIHGKWKFPSGDEAPAAPLMEKFDYRQDSPVRYVVDFWTKPGPTVAEARHARELALREAERKRTEAEALRRKERRIASIRNRQEEEDLSRFCGSPLRDSTDVFLEFIPFHEAPDYTKWLPSTTPDSGYDYYLDSSQDVRKAPGQDATYVRTALQLYREGKFGLTVKTVELYEHDFPKSNFQSEMSFLRTNALIKLGHLDRALPLLKRLVVKERGSAVALHAAMYLAARHALAGETLQALESFLWLSTHFSSHRLNWVFHLGAAEALYQMRQSARAVKEYQWVSKNAPQEKDRAYAAFRIGDLYIEKRQFERALAAYYQAMQKFQAQAELDPGVYLNRAETFYWLGNLARAGEAFKEFLARFPNHPVAWRASYRLGELAARSAAGRSGAEAREWFSNTINRYPYSPGATLARSLLISCGDHSGMTSESASRFFELDALRFDGGAQVNMKRYPDFRALSHVRSLLSFDEHAHAFLASVDELKKGDLTAAGRESIQALMKPIFRKAILADLDAGRSYEALNFYRKYSSEVLTIPEKRGVITGSADYMLRLSRVAADFGMATLAQEISSAYKKFDEKRTAQRQLAAVLKPGSEKKDLESVEIEQIQQERKSSEKNYTLAKSLWIKAGAGTKKDVPDEQRLRDLLTAVSDETEFSYPKEIILGLLDELKAAYPAALTHAQRAQLLITSQSDPRDADRLEAWVARLQAEAGDPLAAIDLYRKLQKRSAHRTVDRKTSAVSQAAVLGVSPVPPLEDLILSEGELHARKGNWGGAADAYSRAVDAGLGGNRALYEYARALDRTGEKERSRKAMERLAESKQEDFWRKLATESIARHKLAN